METINQIQDNENTSSFEILLRLRDLHMQPQHSFFDHRKVFPDSEKTES